MKIVYVECDQNVQDLITMKLEASLDGTVLEFNNEKDALLYLQKDKIVDLVIVDDEAIISPEFLIYDYCRDNLPTKPFILISTKQALKNKKFSHFENDRSCNAIIKKPIGEQEFSEVMAKVLGEISAKQSGKEYHEVKIRNFIKFNSLPVDAFIKISDEKYIKLINKDDVYSSDVVKKYAQKQVQFLYVPAGEYQILADAGIRNLLGLYAKSLQEEDLGRLHLDVIENIHDQINEFGISEEVVQVTKKTIESSIRLVKQHRSVAELLNNMQTNGGYIYDHSIRVSYLTTAIAKQTEWNSDNTCFKLSLAALMHDMTLTDHKLAKIDRLVQARAQNLTTEEIEIIKRHPHEAAALIRSKKSLPTDVDFIVLQHHEKPDGSGFPLGVSKHRVAPFAALFILAHEFLERIDGLKGKLTTSNRDKIIAELIAEEYHRGNFKKPFEGLQKALSDKKMNIKDSL